MTKLNVKKFMTKSLMALMLGAIFTAPVNAATLKNRAVTNFKVTATEDAGKTKISTSWKKLKLAKKYKIKVKNSAGKVIAGKTVKKVKLGLNVNATGLNQIKVSITPIDKKGKSGKTKTVTVNVKVPAATPTTQAPAPVTTPTTDPTPTTQAPTTNTTPTTDPAETHTHVFRDMTPYDVDRYDLDNWYMDAYKICDCGQLQSSCSGHEWRDPVENDALSYNRVIHQGDKVCDKCHILDRTNSDSNHILFDPDADSDLD